MFFGLSYLPPDEVSDGFCDLMSIAPSSTVSGTISIFSDYIFGNLCANKLYLYYSNLKCVCVNVS
ncbi:MULE domain-containing protein [Aphis craccivora]|uniref:MULE domain-containing protein n=1 Tax=Aphis craccivora TaxID=307492 RepID=A0A6G0Z5H6_APHCR|nr:MULE domain-containing protein [Aphis craccivora]